MTNHSIEVTPEALALLDHHRCEGDTYNDVIMREVGAPNPAIHIIQFILENHMELDDPLVFLELWNEGEFDRLREEWNDLELPDEIFIGADTQFVPKE